MPFFLAWSQYIVLDHKLLLNPLRSHINYCLFPEHRKSSTCVTKLIFLAGWLDKQGTQLLEMKPKCSITFRTVACHTSGALRAPYIAFLNFPTNPSRRLGSSAGKFMYMFSYISHCKNARFTSIAIILPSIGPTAFLDAI